MRLAEARTKRQSNFWFRRVVSTLGVDLDFVCEDDVALKGWARKVLGCGDVECGLSCAVRPHWLVLWCFVWTFDGRFCHVGNFYI